MRTLALALPLAALGCAVGPDYERPATAVPGAWTEAGDGRVETGPSNLAAWWSVFGDGTLDHLARIAVDGSPDLRIARLRVREARAGLGVVRGGLLPEVDAQGTYARTKTSESVLTFPGADLHQSFYSVGFDAAWEIDLFGGTRRAVEAAAAELGAAEEDRRGALVSLLGEVARNYVTLRGAQRRASVLRENVRSARETAELTRARLAAGVGTALDVARAESLLAQNEALVPQADAIARQAIHRLGVLVGREPGALAGELRSEAPIPVPPARVGVGIPSELLLRRPDVRAAERRLAAATARVGVAVADFFPRFSLTGAFGLESLDSDDLFTAASRAWTVGPALRWPIFSAGRIRARVAVEEARQEQALAAYERAVLGALEDVENALVGYLREGDRRRALVEARGASRRAVALAEDLHGKGLVSFLDVLEAQRSLYATELLLAESEASVSLQVVALYKALGGGWE